MTAPAHEAAGGDGDVPGASAGMHAGQVDVSADTARSLIVGQFPRFAGEHVRRAPGSGTVNVVFRIGDRHAARFPLLVDDADASLATLRAEADAAHRFALATTVPAPTIVELGAPGPGYPGPWTITTWIDGDVATPDAVADSTAFARDIAGLIGDLRAAPVGDRVFSGAGRGGDLQAHDDWMRTCLDRSGALLDVAALRRAWQAFRGLPRSGDDVMSHTDLIPANLLVRDGGLAGVLDVGGFQPADPALDLVVAWHVFDEPARGELRRALRADALEWARGAAWAFEQAMGLVWYYRDSNPAMSALGRSTLRRIMASDVLQAV